MAGTTSGTSPNVLTGPRCLVSMAGAPIGIFTTVSYSTSLDLTMINLLGRFSPAGSVYTGAEPVSINVSGYRVLNHGPFADGLMPNIQELLTTGYFDFTIIDRQTGSTVASIHGCRATSFNINMSAKSPLDFSMSYVGLLMGDETAENAEPANSTVLPT